jgi:formylglycine-generating enzyme required for sulfatase activity
MKRLLFLFFLSVFCQILLGQNLYVQSFLCDDRDLTAITEGTIVYDKNGNKCALIKVETTLEGLSFNTGSVSSEVVKVLQNNAEIWVYVEEGVKRLTISHLTYGSLSKFDLGNSLERGKTYILRLGLNKSLSVKSAIYGSLAVTSAPSNADVFIDGLLVGKTPLVISQMLVGEHSLKLSYPGYTDYDESINVKEGEIAQITAVIKSASITKESGNNESRREFVVNGVSFTMIYVDGGVFQMGIDNVEKSEYKVHQVTLSSYYIGETEVTQELWQAVMGKNPSGIKGPRKPVDNVSWKDCQKFITILNKKTGTKFRLPTEAEWEFAARGGNKSQNNRYSGSNNYSEVAWYNVTSPRNVKTKKANELGIYDMSGNVFEWCQDWYGDYHSDAQNNPQGPLKGDYHVLRGGNCKRHSRNRIVNDIEVYRRYGEEARIMEKNGINEPYVGLRLAL